MSRDVVPLLALVLLLVAAFRQPRPRIEVGLGLLAVAATAAVGALPLAVARAELAHLGPVVAFLMAILVVAEHCRVEGVFGALGARLARIRTGHRLLALTFLAAAVVTVVLSLDATVVLLTPVVLAVAPGGFRAGELACVRLANSASLLVPVANLTNLLALPSLHLTFARFALLMLPSWLVVLAVEYVVLRGTHRRDLGPRPAVDAEPPPLPAYPIVVVALMLAGFVAASPFGIAPAWVAAAAAALLLAHEARRGPVGARPVIASAQPAFAVFVLCLGLVVAALGRGGLGDLLAGVVPHRADLAGLLAVAVVGAAVVNLVNNLPGTLLLVPVVAPLGTTALLALLIGINVGSSLTWTGSLANLLWRRTLVAAGRTVPRRAFHRTALLATPPAIVLGVLVLDGWSRLLA